MDEKEKPLEAPPKAECWKLFWICVSLAAAIWLVFGQTLRHDFVNYDDDVYVYRNTHVTAGLDLKDVIWAFTHVHSSNWHPLTWMSHMLDCQLYGLKPVGHHLTNVLLHGATTIMLFLVLRRMTHPFALQFAPQSGNTVRALQSRDLSLWTSAFVAFVFAIHPLRVESVAWVAERKDVLSGLFFVLTLWSYVRYAQKDVVPDETSNGGLPSAGSAAIRYWSVVLFFALGLLSKPMLVTMPFLFLLLDVWPLERFGRSTVMRLVIEKLPFFLLAATVCVITFFSQEQAMSSVPLGLRIGNALVSCVVYLQQMVWPAGLAVFYPHPEAGLAAGKVFTASLLLLTISIGTVLAVRSRPWLLIGWLWYLGLQVPVSGILQVGSQAHADRYTYLPQIGVYLMLAWTAASWCANWRHRRLALGIVAGGILMALTFLAHKQTRYWIDSESLWSHTLAVTTNNIVAQNNLGNALVEKGNVDDAIPHFQEALRLMPGHAEAHYNLANALLKKGKADEAIVHYQLALQASPGNARFHYYAGIAYLQKEDLGNAVEQFQQSLRLNPDDVVLRNNLGNAFFQQGKLDEAIAQYQQALQANPKDTKPRYNLGIALMQKGQVDNAIVQFREFLKSTPDNAKAHYSYGTALLQKGEVDQAVAQFRQALDLQPEFPEALNNLAWELATSPRAGVRNGNKAIELAERADRLADGQDPDVLDTLAAAYAEGGRFEDAIRAVWKAIAAARSAGQSDQVEQLNRELKLYQANLPFHRDGP